LSSHLLSKNFKIKIYKTIILPIVLYGCEILSLTPRGDHIDGAEEYFYTQEGRNGRRLEKTA